MTIIDLPSEILDLICQHLANTIVDLCNLRLSCKVFAVVGARHLVPQITLIRIPKSLERLTAIADHTVLRNYVKEIVYCVDEIPHYGNREDFEPHFPGGRLTSATFDRSHELNGQDIDRPERARSRSTREKEVKKAYARYEKLRLQFCAYPYDEEAVILRRAFAKLPRLQSLQAASFLSDGAPFPEQLRWPFLEFYSRGFNLMNCSEQRDVDEGGLGDLRNVLGALGLEKPCLESLNLFSLYFLSIVDTMVQHKPSLTEQSFHSLRKLSLDLGDCFRGEDEDEDEWQDLEDARDLNRVLKRFPNLQELMLSIRPVSNWIEQYPLWSTIFRDISWKGLVRLEMSSITCEPGELLGLLSTNASSLKSLGLTDMNLADCKTSTWINVFADIADQLRLDVCKLMGIFSGDDTGYSSRKRIVIDAKDCVRGYESTLNIGQVLGSLLCAESLYSAIHDEDSSLASALQSLITPDIFRQEVFADLLEANWRRYDNGTRKTIIDLRYAEVLNAMRGWMQHLGRM